MKADQLYRRHRFPPDVISRCVWLYYRFSLSYRDVELMIAERGLVLTYETIRNWCLKFGTLYAKKLKAKKDWGDQWYMDEVYCPVGGEMV
jgi:putative transposase